MSTRSQIAFFEKPTDKLGEFEGLIYRHSDGYPEGRYGILALLIPALWDYNKNAAGQGVYYAMAHIVYILKKEQFGYARKNYQKELREIKKGDRKNRNYSNIPDKNRAAKNFEESTAYHYAFLSIGTSSNDDYHGDVQYVYRVDLSLKQLKVYKTNQFIFPGKNPGKNVTLLYIVPFSAEEKNFTNKDLKKYAPKRKKVAKKSK